MNNFQQRGERLRLFPTESAEPGDIVVAENLVGIAFSKYDIADGDGVVCDLVGVYELPKKSGPWTQGQELYYDASTKAVGTEKGDGGIVIGLAAEPATIDAALGSVRLKG